MTSADTGINKWDLLRRLTASWLQYPRREDRGSKVLSQIARQFSPSYDPAEPPPVTGVGFMADDRIVVMTDRPGVTLVPEEMSEFYRTRDVSAIVIHTGPFKPCLTPGDSIGFGSPTGPSGTTGAIVNDAAGTPFVLSCNHVIADTNRGAPKKDEVWSPGCAKGGTSASRIGILHDVQTLDLSGTGPNSMDAATAKPLSGIALTTSIPMIGVVSGTNISPAFNISVEKYGDITGHTTGDLTVKSLSVLVNYGSASALFIDQYGVIGHYGVPFAKDGDSGSLVVDSTSKEALGLLFAISGTGEFALVNPIDPIAMRFGLSF